MRDVRRLVILDWLLGGAGERWTTNADHLSEVDRVQARAILESQRTGLREGLRRAMQECYGAAAPTPGHAGRGRCPRPGAGQPGFQLLTRRAGRRRPGGGVRQPHRPGVHRHLPGHPRFEPGDVEVTVRDLAAVYSHVERAVADRDGRVRLEGDIAAVRRVANALQVGTAGETHFLFGDDRFSPWGAEFERAAARDGLQPQDPVRVGQVRDWIDAMRPELGLRDEVADLVVLAWAALRQRAWYQHGVRFRAPRPVRSDRTWNCGPSRCPPRATGSWQCRGPRRCLASTSTRTSPLQASPSSPRTPRWTSTSSPTLPGAGRPGRGGLPAPGHARGPALAGWRPPVPGLTGGSAAPGRSRVQLVADAGPGRRCRPPRRWSPTRSAGRRRSPPQWARSAGSGSPRCVRPQGQANERGRAAASTLEDLRDAVAADEFTTGLGPPSPHRAGDLRLAGPGQPAAADTPPTSRRGECPQRRGRAARAARRPGQRAPPAVLGQLTAFLDAHHDEQVIVEWRVRGDPHGTRATLPVMRALLDQAGRKDYRCGVLGVRARPEWAGAPSSLTRTLVRVVACVSALAVREAIIARDKGEWLVVLTDREDDDLGAGVLSHLVGHRLRTPDPWEAVRLRFAATGLDPALTSSAVDREIAIGLLAAAPPAGWPPGPGRGADPRPCARRRGPRASRPHRSGRRPTSVFAGQPSRPGRADRRPAGAGRPRPHRRRAGVGRRALRDGGGPAAPAAGR